MAAKAMILAQLTLFLTLCSCQRAPAFENHVTARKDVLGDKEYVISWKGKTANLVFVPWVGGLDDDDVHLRVKLEDSSAEPSAGIGSHLIALPYREAIQAIRQVMEVMSAEYDMSRLQSLNLDTWCLGEECLNISRRYREIYGTGDNIHSSQLANIVASSKLIADIRKMVEAYGCTIDQIRVQNPTYSEAESFYKNNAIHTDPAYPAPYKLIRSIVYVTLVQAQH